MRKLVLSLLAMLMLVLAAGCGAAGPAAVTGIQSGEVKVTLKNMRFTPAKFTVKKGTTVTFINQDVQLHDVVQIAVKEYGKAAPGFESGEIEPGKSWAVTFDKAGEFPIICTQSAHFTAGMVATITVVE